MKTAFVTGVAGFVGSAVAARLLADGYKVVGVDSLNDYYDPALKKQRVALLKKHAKAKHFTFRKLDLVDRAALVRVLKSVKPGVVIHLAAQASVRYGLVNPVSYLERNLIGHFNVLEAMRLCGIGRLLYASSSSVYGANEKVPFAESDDVSRPVSLYAATKRADELITEAWCHQFGLKATGLRFFTVYGPWGRPDMSPMIFARAIVEGKKIPLFNKGDLWRDFTFVDDIVEAVVRLMGAPEQGHSIYNLGNQNPVRMDEFVRAMEKALGRKAKVDLLPWPSTEVYKTYADTRALKKAVGWAPGTSLEDGLRVFAEWFVPWHAKNK
ncbi:MAG TPA: NAD-dependent epimerase/dehydratase family protein [Alphaproteobacteria bacterium]|nr:NAD-dependent epimerase/dehydratase family protein [Alphaproteobacteria bacterium]